MLSSERLIAKRTSSRSTEVHDEPRASKAPGHYLAFRVVHSSAAAFRRRRVQQQREHHAEYYRQRYRTRAMQRTG